MPASCANIPARNNRTGDGTFQQGAKRAVPQTVESGDDVLPLHEMVMEIRFIRRPFALDGTGAAYQSAADSDRQAGLHLEGARIEAVEADEGRSTLMEIGDDTVIHMNFHCGAAESVKIGKDVLIAGGVYITDHDHVFDDPDVPARWADGLVSKPVVIGDGAWLGEGCVILKGVTVGCRAVVAANAVVTKDVPPGAVVGGIPAKVIK